jgi:hypothetical protein
MKQYCKAVTQPLYSSRFKTQKITCNRRAEYDGYCWQHHRIFKQKNTATIPLSTIIASSIIGGFIWYLLFRLFVWIF